MTRKRMLFGISISLIVGILLYGIPFASAQDNRPIKIGFLASFTGPLAKVGTDMHRGFQLALDEVGDQVDGRHIVVIVEDDETRPEEGPTKARDLIEKDKVDMIAGLAHSGVALSIRDIVVKNKIPLIITNAGADDLTGKLKSPYIFRVSFANGQRDLAPGWYAYHKMGLKRMAVISPDFVAGYETANGFIKTFQASGGQIVKAIYPPLSTNDFGPYLAEVAALVKSKSIDGVWSFFPPPAGMRLVNQFAEFGLKQSIPLFVMNDMVEESLLPFMKDAALGTKNYGEWALLMNSPENQEFVKAYVAKYKTDPSAFSERGYVGAKAILLALHAVHGKIENKQGFLEALRKVQFEAPNGHFRFDANQNIVFSSYLFQVEKLNGVYHNVIVDKMADNVGQNWTPAKIKQ